MEQMKLYSNVFEKMHAYCHMPAGYGGAVRAIVSARVLCNTLTWSPNTQGRQIPTVMLIIWDVRPIL